MPAYFDENNTPVRTDARWKILQKWLGVIQSSGGLAANDPELNDTRWTLLRKINCAKVGVAYPG